MPMDGREASDPYQPASGGEQSVALLSPREIEYVGRGQRHLVPVHVP